MPSAYALDPMAMAPSGFGRRGMMPFMNNGFMVGNGNMPYRRGGAPGYGGAWGGRGGGLYGWDPRIGGGYGSSYWGSGYRGFMPDTRRGMGWGGAPDYGGGYCGSYGSRYSSGRGGGYGWGYGGGFPHPRRPRYQRPASLRRRPGVCMPYSRNRNNFNGLGGHRHDYFDECDLDYPRSHLGRGSRSSLMPLSAPLRGRQLPLYTNPSQNRMLHEQMGRCEPLLSDYDEYDEEDRTDYEDEFDVFDEQFEGW